MDFLEFKISNIQKELNDLNNYIITYREKVENDLLSQKENNNKQQKSTNVHNEKLFKNNKIEKDEDNEKEKEGIEEGKLTSDNIKLINKKNWASIVEEEEETSHLRKKFELLEREYRKLNDNISFIKKHLNLNENSKILKFNFYHCTITWELKDEHFVGNQVKIILNPVPFNKEIYQIFYFNNKENKLGFKVDKEYRWFKISFKEKLIEYQDENHNNKYVYCSFVEKQLD